MAALGSVDNALLLAEVSDPTDDQTDRMTLLVSHASDAVRNYAGLNFDQSTTTDKLVGTWGPVLELPQWPVTAVSAVTVNGATVTGWEWDGRRGIRRWAVPSASLDYIANGPWEDDAHPRQGAARRGGDGHWGGPRSTIGVTYTHGWATIPADVAAIVEGMAASSFRTPAGIRQEQLGTYSVTYAVEALGASTRITIHESRQLDGYRHRFA